MDDVLTAAQPQRDEKIALRNIIVEDRERVDLGDLASLVDSIKLYGIIQPVVLSRSADGAYKLIAGGRRLAALDQAGFTDLEHAKHWVYRDEVDPVALKAMELEENLRRKDLSWSEIVLGKRKLLLIMQSLKGIGGSGRGRKDGFSQKSLAEMLGENPTQTSRDLELADYVIKFPDLATLPTRYDAQRKLGVAYSMAAMQTVVIQRQQQAALATPPPPAVAGQAAVPQPQPRAAKQAKPWYTLHKGDFFVNASLVADASVDLVLTDLPYNIGLGDSTAAHGAGLGQFTDTIPDPVAFYGNFAVECFRILCDNRFAVIFFGFADYVVLTMALSAAGFTVEPYPVIWIRDRTAPPDGTKRYSKMYDPALICTKGEPRFVIPNSVNIIQCPSVRGADRLHAAQKPVAVMEKFIREMTVEGAIVCDPMAGAGSSGVAALQNKRNCILFEIEQHNCLLIETRLNVI